MPQRTILKTDADPSKGKVGTYKLYDDGTILLINVRLSYPHVGTKGKFTDDDGKVSERWGVKGLMPKKTHGAAKEVLKGMIDDLITANKTAFKAGEKVMLPPDRKFLADGDKTSKTENEGCFVFSCSDVKNKPSARDRKGRPLTVEEADSLFYGGCFGNVLIRPWFQNNKKWGKRVNANFCAVQFYKDGEPFGEGRLSEEDLDDTFDSYEDDDDAGFDDDDDTFDDDDDL